MSFLHLRSQAPSLLWIFIFIILWSSLVYLFNKSPFQSNITQFFPNQQSIESLYLKNHMTSNQSNSWLMLSIRANQLNQPLHVISQTTQAKLQMLKGIKQVLNGSAPFQSPLQQRHTPELYKYRYLLTPLTPEALPSQIQQRWQEYQLGFVLDKNWLLDDPTFQWASYQNRITSHQQLPKANGVWMSHDQTAALLLIETEKRPEVLKNTHQKLEQLLGKNNFQLSGAEWIAMQAEQQIKQAVNWTTSLALGMILLALFIAFRSPKLIFLSSLPLLGAFIVGILSTVSLFGSMQLVTLALGAILLGVAIDYPIHTISAYQSLKKSTIEKIWSTVRLGAFTSAFGFLALFWIDIEGLQQMAVFASSGLLSAILITHSLKPHLASHFKLNKQESILKPLKTPTLNLNKKTTQVVTLFFLGLVITVGILLLKPVQWQDDIASLSPVSSDLIKTDATLRTLFQYKEVGKQLLLPAKDIESLLQQEEALLAGLNDLMKAGSIQKFQLLAQALPSQALQATRQKTLPTEIELAEKMKYAVENTQFKATHFQSFLRSVEQSRQQPLVTYEDFIQFDSTNAQLARQLVLSMPDKVIGVILLSGVKSDAALQDFVQKNSQSGLIYFNQRALVANQIQQIRSNLFQILGFVLIILGIGIWFRYRNIKQVFIVLSPVILSIGLTVASLTLLNISLSIFHLMSLMLIAAIGIDYSLLFFQGAQQPQDSKEWSKSIRIAFYTTLGSFSILSLSPLALLNAIGLTVLIGILWVYSLTYLMSKAIKQGECKTR